MDETNQTAIGLNLKVITEAGVPNNYGNVDDIGINKVKFYNPNHIQFIDNVAYLSDTGNKSIRKIEITPSDVNYDPTLPKQSIVAPEEDIENVHFGNAISSNDSFLLISSKSNYNINEDGEEEYEGKVYIYQSDDITKLWSKIAELTPPDEMEGTDIKDKSNIQFGKTLLMFQSTAFVGCENYDYGTGIVYIYKPSGSDWTLTQKLQGSLSFQNHLFGHSLSAYVNSETGIGNLFIGAPKKKIQV